MLSGEGRKGTARTSSRQRTTPSLTAYDQSPSRSVSPLEGPVRLKKQKIVPNLRIGVREGVAFDECRTERRSEARKQRWELPGTREELITRYSSRFRGSQESFLPSPFPAYKLDAAELLLSRLSKLLAKSLHALQRHAFCYDLPQQWPGKRGKSVQRSREQGEPVSFTWEEEESRGRREDIFVVSEGMRPSEEVETPKPFQMWKDQEFTIETLSYGQKTQKTSGIMSEISTNLTHLLEPVARLLQSHQVHFLLSIYSISQRKRALSALHSTLLSLLQKRTLPFFSHELFRVPSPEYYSCKEMIVNVNGLASALTRTVKTVGLRRLREAGRGRRLGAGVGRLWVVVGGRAKEQFNRLRFLSEVLGDFREREKRRIRIRRALTKVFHLLFLRSRAAQQAGLVALWRCLRLQPRSAATVETEQTGREEERRKAMGSMVAVLRRNAEFRVRTAVVVWRNRGKTSTPASDRHLATLLISLSAKFSLRQACFLWHFRPPPPYPLLAVLCTTLLSRCLFSWSRLASHSKGNTRLSAEFTYRIRTFVRVIEKIGKGKTWNYLRIWAKQRRKRAKMGRIGGLRIGQILQKRRKLQVRSTFYRLVCSM